MRARLPLGAGLVAASLLAAAAPARPGAGGICGYPDFELVESAPIETTLDHPDIRNAAEVWLEMIDGARHTLDLSMFYVSNAPGEPLEPIVEAIESAAARGVAVRFISDRRFHETYPETLDRLNAAEGIRFHTIDFSETSGGVLHCKYFIVDGESVYLGSQNFDWRSLKHIQELGVRVKDAAFARPIQALFDRDFRFAASQAGADPGPPRCGAEPGAAFPIRRAVATAETLTYTPVMSPTGYLPDETLWDLPRLIELIDGAERAVSVQLLTYRPVSHDGSYFEAIENAIRGAAARGVQVNLLVADWCKRSSTIPYLKSLAVVPGIEVRMTTIPEWSGGFIPYARVIHAKYLVVDGVRGWIGTSNWEKGYFHESRNVGVVVESDRIGAALDRFFRDTWESPYAYAVQPALDYEPPRIGE